MKKIYFWNMFIFMVTAIYALLTKTSYVMIFVSCLLPFIIFYILYKLKIKLTYSLKNIILIFIYFSSLVGSGLYGYRLPYFDKIIHFMSGFLFTEIGYILWKYHMKEEKLMFYFINMFNASIALLWEFYEYFLFVFFKYDAIKHQSGIHDTLTDMLLACRAGLLLSSILYDYKSKKKSHFLISLEEDFRHLNQ